RNLTNIFHKTIENNMPITFDIDIENDVLYKRGEIKGETKKSKQVVINLIKEGCTNEFISKITNLTIEEIEEIRKEIK
ncbi:MAG: hypothetical protein EAZ31_00780, partial [Cytophagia bacterium]